MTDTTVPKNLTIGEFIAMNRKQRKVAWLDIPEMGGRVYVRRLTCREREQLVRERDRIAAGEDGVLRATWMAAYLCTSDGVPMFSANVPEHMEILSNLPDAIGEMIVLKAMEVNTSRPDDAAALEAAIKN